jgi:transcriptional regulator with XRE-family HTH domain
MDPPFSRRQAAARAGLSPSQWSDIERGSKKAGQGSVVPVRATAETLARMAQTVGLAAGDLATAGRQDAASLLDDVEQERDLRHRLSAVPGLAALAGQLRPGSHGARELLPAIAASLAAIEDSSLSDAARRQLTDMFVGNLRYDAARRHTELLLLLRIATGNTDSN